MDKQTQEIRDWEREEIHDSQWIGFPPPENEKEKEE